MSTGDSNTPPRLLKEWHAVKQQFVVLGVLFDGAAVPFAKSARVISVKELFDLLSGCSFIQRLTCQLQKQGNAKLAPAPLFFANH